ncbi:hypothetical protein Tco_0104370 [Tanacetum coccineum]
MAGPESIGRCSSSQDDEVPPADEAVKKWLALNKEVAAKAIASVLAGNADLCSKTSDLEPIVLYYTNCAAKKMSSKKFGKAMVLKKAFGRYTRDLGSFGEETDKTTDLHQHCSRISPQKLETASQITRDAVTTISKKASQDLKTASDFFSDGAKLVVESVPDYLLALSSKDVGWKGWGEISYGRYKCVKCAKVAKFLARSWRFKHIFYYMMTYGMAPTVGEADMIAVNDGAIICSHVATYYRDLQVR